MLEVTRPPRSTVGYESGVESLYSSGRCRTRLLTDRFAGEHAVDDIDELRQGAGLGPRADTPDATTVWASYHAVAGNVDHHELHAKVAASSSHQ